MQMASKLLKRCALQKADQQGETELRGKTARRPLEHPGLNTAGAGRPGRSRDPSPPPLGCCWCGSWKTGCFLRIAPVAQQSRSLAFAQRNRDVGSHARVARSAGAQTRGPSTPVSKRMDAEARPSVQGHRGSRP